MANMGVLSIYHPDIEEYIEAKANDPNVLKHFNMSVMVDDFFMEAVEDNRDIYLHYPVYDDKGNIERNFTKWEQRRKISAVKLWDKIMRQAYNTGEPGILQYGTMNDNNNTWYIEKIVATNPCFTGDMELLTHDGDKFVCCTFESLCGKDDISVVTKDYTISHNNKVWCSGIKDVVEIRFSNRELKPIKCTPDHIFMLWDGSECKAKDLKGKRICTQATASPIRYVADVVPIGKEPVYDFTEHKTHWGIVNGVVVHNCGEYLAGTMYGTNPITNEELNSKDYGGACNLGSIMLHKMVEYPFTNHAHLSEYKLCTTVKSMVRMLDNIIDVNKFPHKIYENYQKNMRTIGLGATGLADALAMMGFPYDDLEARVFTDKLFEKIALTAYKESIELAKEKGSFPFLDKEKFVKSDYIQRHLKYNPKEWQPVVDDILKYGIRNARILSVAPTGTLSLVWGNNCSSGIEPIFSLEYDRKVNVGGQDDSCSTIIKMRDYAYEMARQKQIPIDPQLWTTATEMSVDDHIDMLAVIAKHVDMSVSKTINIPTDYSFEATKDVYMKCWKFGIKGCTIFRPNAVRKGILLKDNDDSTNTEDNKPIDIPRGYIVDVSDDLIAAKRTLQTGCGKLYLHLDFDEYTGQPLETWLECGSGGGCERNLTLISRLISTALRSGVPIQCIIDQCLSVKPCKAYCDRTKTKGDTSKGTSCASAIGYALIELNEKIHNRCFDGCEDEIDTVEVHNGVGDKVTEIVDDDMICPECGSMLSMEGGCVICRGDETHSGCGWSHCG